MKIRKHITCMTLALAMLLGLSGMASAQVMPDGMGNSGWITGDPSLSPEKQTAVRNIYNEYYQSTAVLRQQYYAKHSELNAQLYGGNTDDRRVQVLIKEISDVNSRIFENQVNLRRRLIREGVSFGSYEYGGYGRHNGMGAGGGMGYGMHGGY
jgi:hypothetical protein